MKDRSSPVVVARIAKTHGIRGEVVLESLSDVEGRLENTNDFLLLTKGRQQEVKIESRRFFNGRYVVKFQGIDTLSEVELFKGAELAVPEERIGKLPTDQFFIHDLVGMVVKLRDGRIAGKVVDVLKTGGVDLLQLNHKDGPLIPFASAICVEVNPDAKEITVDPPEGLLDESTLRSPEGDE